MENKILVELSIPMLDAVYDVFIPISKTVSKVTELLEKSISELSNVVFTHQENIALYDISGRQIEPNLTIRDSEITNGSKLILM